MNAAFGCGFVLGPALGGLLGNVNPRLPFWSPGPQTAQRPLRHLRPARIAPAEESQPLLLGARQPVGSLRLLRNNKVLFGLSAVLVLGYLAQQSFMNVYVLYADYRYGWTDRTVGFSLALVGICTIFYGAVLVKPLVAIGERGAMTIGLIGGAIGYAMIGLSKTGLLVWSASPSST